MGEEEDLIERKLLESGWTTSFAGWVSMSEIVYGVCIRYSYHIMTGELDCTIQQVTHTTALISKIEQVDFVRNFVKERIRLGHNDKPTQQDREEMSKFLKNYNAEKLIGNRKGWRVRIENLDESRNRLYIVDNVGGTHWTASLYGVHKGRMAPIITTQINSLEQFKKFIAVSILMNIIMSGNLEIVKA